MCSAHLAPWPQPCLQRWVSGRSRGHSLSQAPSSLPGTPGRVPPPHKQAPVASWPGLGEEEARKDGVRGAGPGWRGGSGFSEWNFLVATCLEGMWSRGRRSFAGGIRPQGQKRGLPSPASVWATRPLPPQGPALSRFWGLRCSSRARPAPCQERRLLGTQLAGSGYAVGTVCMGLGKSPEPFLEQRLQAGLGVEPAGCLPSIFLPRASAWPGALTRPVYAGAGPCRQAGHRFCQSAAGGRRFRAILARRSRQRPGQTGLSGEAWASGDHSHRGWLCVWRDRASDGLPGLRLPLDFTRGLHAAVCGRGPGVRREAPPLDLSFQNTFVTGSSGLRRGPWSQPWLCRTMSERTSGCEAWSSQFPPS